MSRCVQIIVDDPQNKGRGGGGRGCVCKIKCVRVPVCYQLSRRAAGCRRTKFSGSCGSGFSVAIVHTLAATAQTIPTRQFASSATTGMGENSPTSYTLQGFSLKTWVNFHPQHIPRQICILFIYFLIILKLCVSQTYTIFSKHKGKKVVDKVMKFPFHW